MATLNFCTTKHGLLVGHSTPCSICFGDIFLLNGIRVEYSWIILNIKGLNTVELYYTYSIYIHYVHLYGDISYPLFMHGWHRFWQLLIWCRIRLKTWKPWSWQIGIQFSHDLPIGKGPRISTQSGGLWFTRHVPKVGWLTWGESCGINGYHVMSILASWLESKV